jgi:UDP-3-O-[3-hydroxymyristoyl] glucosamine N-acyltransferase
VLLGGQVGIAGHLKLGDGSGLLAQSGLTGDVPPGAVFAGTPAIPVITHHRFTASIPRLLELLSTARALEKRVKALESEKNPASEKKPDLEKK